MHQSIPFSTDARNYVFTTMTHIERPFQVHLLVQPWSNEWQTSNKSTTSENSFIHRSWKGHSIARLGPWPGRLFRDLPDRKLKFRVRICAPFLSLSQFGMVVQGSVSNSWSLKSSKSWYRLLDNAWLTNAITMCRMESWSEDESRRCVCVCVCANKMKGSWQKTIINFYLVIYLFFNYYSEFIKIIKIYFKI